MLMDKDKKVLGSILHKAWDFEIIRNTYSSKTEVEEDLLRTNEQTPIDWEKLLRSPAHLFLHDVLGIHKHHRLQQGRVKLNSRKKRSTW